jgi:putative MATE family efflux protein
MLAQLGEAALAAVGLSGVLLWRLRSLSGVLQIGVTAVAARRWGEGDQQAAGIVLSHAAVLGLLIGSLALLLIPITQPIFQLLNAEGDVLRFAAIYFQLVAISMPFRMASGNLTAVLRAAGDTRTPMLVTLAINLLNALLNYLLIFGKFGFPALGMMGAGISTLTAFMVEAGILWYLCQRGIRARLYASDSRGTLRFHPAGWRLWLPGLSNKLVRLSIPSVGEELAVSVGFLVFIAMIAGLGPDALAAHTSVARIESFSYMIGFGMAVAAASLTGQALGALQPDRAARLIVTNLVIVTVAMGGAGILMALLATPSLRLFFSPGAGSERLLELALPIFLIAAIEQPLIGTSMVLAASLRGAGLTMAPFLSQMIGTIAIRVGLGWLLAFHLGWGLEGIYWATVADWGMRTLVLGIIAFRGTWKQVRV